MAVPGYAQCGAAMLLGRRAASNRESNMKTFSQDTRASAAIEFGLVFPVFAFLAFLIMETALGFFQAMNVESALASTAREMWTGGIADEAGFKTAVCEKIFTLIDCPNQIQTDVQSFAPGGVFPTLDPASRQFSPGNTDDVVIARVFFDFNYFLPVPIATQNNIAVAVFRNQ
jgi:Flp pilus assembly protein TadG